MLLEVPLPIRERSKLWKNISEGLQSAEEQFRNGDYHACVSNCRMIIDELGQHKFKRKEWAGSSLSRLVSNQRKEMSKNEREDAILAALRHYTHLAHHVGSGADEINYSRADAQLVLTLVASLVAHGRSE